MSIQELFIMSNQALRKSIEQIAKDQWKLQLPPGTSRKPTTLEAAVRYHTYDDAWVPDVLAGKTSDEVGDEYEVLLTGGDILSNYVKYNERACTAVRDFADLERITHLSYGDFPARDYLQHITSFRAFRSYDIAKLIGADTQMSDEFVQALLAEYAPVVDFYRQIGVFPAPLNVSDDANAQTKLLAMVGRS